MIDFVLQNPSVPAGSLYRKMLASLIQGFHPDGTRALNYPGEPCQAETAFVKNDFVISRNGNLRIDDHLEGNWTPVFFCQFFRRQTPK
jgi:hypothetical protein